MSWKEFDYTQWKKENDDFDHETYNKKMKEALSASKTVDDLLKQSWPSERPPFKPLAYYNADGDKIDVLLTDEETFAKWLCPGITVYLSHDTHDIVGVEICGIKKLINRELQ